MANVNWDKSLTKHPNIKNHDYAKPSQNSAKIIIVLSNYQKAFHDKACIEKLEEE